MSPALPKLISCALAVAVLSIGGASTTFGMEEKPPDIIQQSAKQVVALLAKYKLKPIVRGSKVSAAEGYQISRLTNEPCAKIFPERVFFGVYFLPPPVGPKFPPESGLTVSSIFVCQNGKPPQLVTNAKQLDAFFRKEAPSIKNQAEAKQVVEAWLWSTKELVEVIGFGVGISDDGVQVAMEGKKQIATGKLIARMGGTGQYEVTITFNEAGRIEAIKEQNKLKQDSRE